MSNPVRIRDVDYPSQAAAARALGVSTTAIARALAKGRVDDVRAGRTGMQPIPVTIHGVTYPSRVAAARAYGVSMQSMYMRVMRGTLDKLPRLPSD